MNPDQTARALVAVAAVAVVSTEFERLYGFIWGSQIRALQMLNAAPASTAQLRPLYDQAASAFPDAYKAYMFEQWLASCRGKNSSR